VETVDDALLASVRELGERLAGALRSLPGVVEVRGRGLLVGAELDRPAGPVAADCLAAGLVVGTAGDTVLRLTPPLTVTAVELDSGLGLLGEALA
jgi:acetylornithine/succinyldiaminopimelate/putrescine aminotransferase